MKATLFLILATAACSSEGSVGDTAPHGGRVQVALLAPHASQELDVLFVVDDSPGMFAFQASFVSAFPAFIDAVAGLPRGLPSLHIGVVSPDMGTKGIADPSPGPSIGSGPGSCAYFGKNAVFATSSAVTGSFIRDVTTTDARETNYTGTLSEAFSSIASLGGSGCGFEQPLHAAELAFAQPENAGFLRDGASLAIVVVTNEDDCSIARSVVLGADMDSFGPLQSFRCTRFGVTCKHGGRTPDEMAQVGPKSDCHANETLGYLTSVRDHAVALTSLKSDPRTILFAAIAGEASALEVEMRAPPGGTPVPALKSQCEIATQFGVDVVVPTVRLTDLARAFPRGRVTTMCGGDVRAPLIEIAREVRGLLGDACLTRDIVLPADCVAFDTRADGSSVSLPACTAATGGDCWELVTDPGCLGQGQRIRVNRASTAANDAMVSLRCKL